MDPIFTTICVIAVVIAIGAIMIKGFTGE